jgi:hypothetical protein
MAGRLMALGLTTNPPKLPRSPQAMQTLKRAAARDPLIRRALEASVERAQQEPQVLRRACGQVIQIV